MKLNFSPKLATFALGAVVIGTPIYFFFWLWGAQIIRAFTASWRESTSFWMIALASIVVVAIISGLGAAKDSSFMVWTGVVLGVLGLLAGIGVASFVTPYMLAKNYYNASTETIPDSNAPSYNDRAPYEFATLTSDKSLMNITGDSQITKSLVEVGEYGNWNTLVVQRGWWKGYEVVQNLNLPLYGTSQNENVKFCEFSKEATLREGGSMPHNNLERSIFEKTPLNVSYASDDLYSYCNEQQEPLVVVPLKKIEGFLFPMWKPYGVAVYNGHTGVLDILTDASAIDKLDGPVYPLSLATSQREALVANGTWTDMVINRTSGYVAASANTEVNLNRSDKSGSDYVTALMPRGSSSSIVAVSHMPSSTMIPGQFNKLMVEAFTEKDVRPANSTLIDDIKTRYSQMPDMVNDTLQVFEITSGKDGGWTVSLGREQSVNYRAYVSKDGGDIKLYDRNHKLIAQGSSSSDGSGNVEMIPTDVSTLSTEELTQLGNQVMKELANRAAK